jgi:hypothetical protein
VRTSAPWLLAVISERSLKSEIDARGGCEQQSTKLAAYMRIDELEDVLPRDASMRRLLQTSPSVGSLRLGALGQMPVVGDGANLSS